MTTHEHLYLTPVARIFTPFREKFAVPRQPGLVTAAHAEIHLASDCNREEILRGLDSFSHLWLIFIFHHNVAKGWKPTVRPPRLGGNTRLGVFSTRSPFRPNPVGLSAVKLERIENRQGQWIIHVTGADLVNDTPIVDIKPYIPYADAIPDARGGFADTPPARHTRVSFSAEALAQLTGCQQQYPELKHLIEQVLTQQPEPAYHYQQDESRSYGMTLYDINIRWQRDLNGYLVTDIQPLINPESP
jgi:tRNA-Thr(GGU) m(6)t(6)A37 methyltransferase TsaA